MFLFTIFIESKTKPSSKLKGLARDRVCNELLLLQRIPETMVIKTVIQAEQVEFYWDKLEAYMARRSTR